LFFINVDALMIPTSNETFELFVVNDGKKCGSANVAEILFRSLLGLQNT
jgi:hypothetical protein